MVTFVFLSFFGGGGKGNEFKLRVLSHWIESNIEAIKWQIIGIFLDQASISKLKDNRHSFQLWFYCFNVQFVQCNPTLRISVYTFYKRLWVRGLSSQKSSNFEWQVLSPGHCLPLRNILDIHDKISKLLLSTREKNFGHFGPGFRNFSSSSESFLLRAVWIFCSRFWVSLPFILNNCVDFLCIYIVVFLYF